jgi:hypothetical protein
VYFVVNYFAPELLPKWVYNSVQTMYFYLGKGLQINNFQHPVIRILGGSYGKTGSEILRKKICTWRLRSWFSRPGRRGLHCRNSGCFYFIAPWCRGPTDREY